MNTLHRADASASRSTSIARRAPSVMRGLRPPPSWRGSRCRWPARARPRRRTQRKQRHHRRLHGAPGRGRQARRKGGDQGRLQLGDVGDRPVRRRWGAARRAELQQIDADLKNINSTLNLILSAIEDETCNETQIAPSLQNAVNDVTELYNEYQTFVTNAARTPPVPPSQAQVVAWQNEVLENVPGDLNAIHNGVYATVNANVIHQCAVSTASDWRTSNPSPTAATLLDDRPSYAQLINIVNYYYGVMLQGATILVEADHLQACQAAAQDDPDLHCDFTTASTGTSPSEIDELCDTSSDADVQRACLAAEEAVTNPDTGAGMYERVEAWLKAAGAPYATDKLGITQSIGSDTSSWALSYAYLFPKRPPGLYQQGDAQRRDRQRLRVSADLRRALRHYRSAPTTISSTQT